MKRVGKYVIFTTPSPAAKPVLEFLASKGIIDADQIADHKHYLTRDEIENHGYKHRYFEAGFNQLGYCGDVSYTSEMNLYIYIILFVSALMLFHSRLNIDDLLRHLKSHTFGYDYSKVYIHAKYLPSFNPWIGFEVLAGAVHSVFGFQSYIVMQILCSVIVVTGLFLFTRGVEENTRMFMIFLVFLLIQHRLMLARPGEFFTGFLLILWALDDRLNRLIKFAIGIILSPLYWFFFIYLVPLVLKDRIYIYSLIGGVTGWILSTHGEYIRAIINIFNSIGELKNMKIAENMGMFPTLLFFFPLFIPVLFGFKKDKKTLLGMVWFVLSNQIRYLENVLTLSVAYLKHMKIKIPGFVLLCIFPVLIYFPDRVPSHNYDLTFLKDKKVFCMDMMSMYDVIYRVDRVKISPLMASIWNDDVVKKIYHEKLKGNIDCESIKKLGVDYVLEKGEFKTNPPCLKFDRVAGPYRVWRIKRESTTPPSRKGLHHGSLR